MNVDTQAIREALEKWDKNLMSIGVLAMYAPDWIRQLLDEVDALNKEIDWLHADLKQFQAEKATAWVALRSITETFSFTVIQKIAREALEKLNERPKGFESTEQPQPKEG